ncbi:MAG: hypothetical protein AAGC47_05295 [Bacteroidota bacterium]
MKRRELTDLQHLKVIDFLKRWGIESPELAYELTDHYSEIALERMAQGEPFERVMDSWKTKKHFRELRKIQSEFVGATRKKWWRAHWHALKRVFVTKQVAYYLGVLGLITLAYVNGFGAIFSFVLLIIVLLIWIIFAYLSYSEKYRSFFELRELTMPAMGSWLIIYYSIAHGAHEKILSGELIELPAPLLAFSILSLFVGYNLIRMAYDEVKNITEEYIREADKYNIL